MMERGRITRIVKKGQSRRTKVIIVGETRPFPFHREFSSGPTRHAPASVACCGVSVF